MEEDIVNIINNQKEIIEKYRKEINKLNDTMNRLEDALREIYDIYCDGGNVDEWIEKIKEGE